MAEQEILRLSREIDVEPERLEAANLDPNHLADIMRGGSLFATKRLVVLRELSEQKHLWELVAEWSKSMTDDTTIVLIETKPDRRTRAYKALAKHAKIIQATAWSERDHGAAEAWLGKLAHDRKVKLSKTQVANMVARSMVAAERGLIVDQYQLAHAVVALSLVDEVTDAAIATVLPEAIDDVLFDLIGFAVNRETTRVYGALANLRLNEDPYKVFPMLAAEWSRLVAVAVSDGSPATVAADLGVHPFVVEKLFRLRGQFTREQLADLTRLAADIDAGMKLSQFEPWDGIDRFVLGILTR